MSVATIKSIELQLVRVESVDPNKSGQFFREATEIQLIQIGKCNPRLSSAYVYGFSAPV